MTSVLTARLQTVEASSEPEPTASPAFAAAQDRPPESRSRIASTWQHRPPWSVVARASGRQQLPRVRGEHAVADTDLPQVGDMFLTGTLVFNNGDHAEFRPVVVVRAPQRSEDLLTTIQRSSTATWQRGIDHPADRSLGLTLSARCDHFLASANRLGRLHAEWLDPLIAAWEEM